MDVTAIDGGLEKLGFQLFRAWTATAESAYPTIRIRIQDETRLVADLEKAFHAAFDSLRQSSDARLGWRVGFFLGFIESNLNVAWCHEYLAKNSDSYKTVMALQATYRHLANHPRISEEIQGDYLESVSGGHNLTDFDPRISATLSAVHSQMEFPFLARIQTELNSDIFTCLDNLIDEKIRLVTTTNWGDHMPDLKTFLTISTVEALLAANVT